MNNIAFQKYLTENVRSHIIAHGATDKTVNKLTEAEMYKAFEPYLCGDWVYVDEGEVPYVFDGRSFRKSNVVEMRSIVRDVLTECYVGMVYVVNSPSTIVSVTMDKLLTDENHLFKPNRRWVSFLNGVLDTHTGKLHEHSIKYITDLVLDFEYHKDAASPLWTRLLSQTIPDTGMREAFKQFCGAWMVDRSKFKIEYICLMVGSGRNGKSIVCEAVAGLFGSSLVSSYSPEQLFRLGTQSMYNLADIDGKMANYADDVSNKDFSGGEFKQFTSGAKFMARHIYGRPFTVTRVPLMLCCVNDIPPTTDDTNGYFRRLLPIMCPNYVADKDVDESLPDKLSQVDVRAAIFNWLYEGYQTVIKQNGKILLSDSIRAVRENIKEDSNSVRRWWRDRSDDDKNGWFSFKVLAQEYNENCRLFGEPQKTAKSLSKVFNELCIDKQRRRDTTWYKFGDATTTESVECPPDDDDDRLPF